MLNALMASLGELVVKTRLAKGLSQAGFAKLVGVDTRTIGNLEVGRTKSVKLINVPALARELGISPDELIAMFPDEDRDPQRRSSSSSGFAPLDFNQPPRWDLDVRASTWAKMPLCELDPDDPRQRAVLELRRFQLRILGRCMSPNFPDGSIVEFEMISWSEDGMEIGDCYAVCKCDGDATFKQLVRRDEESIYLAALNQQEFPGEIRVPIQEIGRVARIAGVMKAPGKIPVVKIR